MRRGRKLRSDVLVNLVFAVLKAGVLMLLIRVAASNLVALELGLFLFARRFSGTAANLLQCGASQTLLRYVALHASDDRAKRAYTVFALAAWGAAGVLTLVPWALAAGPLARLLFPAQPAGDLAFWTGGLVVAMVLDFLVRSVLIAERRLVAANLVELLTGGGFALVALGLHLPTVADLLRFQAVSIALLCGATALTIVRPSARWARPGASEWRAVGQAYLVYGLPRGLITFLDMGLLLVGPWLLRADAVAAGYLLVALSIVQLFAAAMGPIAQVAMVVTARLAGEDNRTAIKEGVGLLLGAILYTVLPLFALLAPWGGLLTRFWLGDEELAAGVLHQVSILAWGILPFSLFQGMKGVVEAYWVRPFNLFSLLLAYLTLLAVIAVLPAPAAPGSVAVALVFAFWVAGGATLVWLRAFLPGARYFAWPRLTALLVAVAVTSGILSSAGGPLAFGAAVGASVAAVVVLVRFLPTPFTVACQALVWPL